MINLSYYTKQRQLVELQFELVRFALNAPSVSKIFFSQKKKKENAEADELHKQILEIFRKNPNAESVKEIVEKHFEKSKQEDMREIRKKFKLTNIRTYEEMVSNPSKVVFVNNKTIENTRGLCSRIPYHACKIAKEKFPRFQISDE